MDTVKTPLVVKRKKPVSIPKSMSFTMEEEHRDAVELEAEQRELLAKRALLTDTEKLVGEWRFLATSQPL